MKSAYWAYWLVLLGVFIVIVMLLFQNLTTTSTQNYSTLQEIAEASLIDAIDYGYYRTYSELKINKEKFMEVFISRMAAAYSGSSVYTIEFYDIIECPPKISVKVSTSSQTFNIAGDSTSYDLVNTIDAILEGGVLTE